jgi:AcrR family transcriptional regulator
MPDDVRPQRRRQARGVRRMGEILDAAAELFAEVGYDSATTNAIAARAGISPGSLYQFFAGKEDIAQALADRYVPELERAHREATAGDLAGLGLDDLIDRVVDPIVAVNVANPGMKDLIGRSELPEHIMAPARRVQGAVVGRVADVIEQQRPGLDVATRTRYATTVLRLFATFVPLAVAAAPDERDLVITDFKTVLRGYLNQVMG